MTDIVKLYNPANASSLTPAELEGLQKLTNDEIKQLAVAYPNITMQRAYLLIIDSSKPAVKQLPTLSSFENLWNLKVKNALKNYVAYSFTGVYKPMTIPHVNARRSEVLDLSDTELMTLPGFKTAAQEHAGSTVAVNKIKKEVKQTDKQPSQPETQT